MANPLANTNMTAIDAFAAEVDDLRQQVEALPESTWQAPTAFKSWRIWDVIAHLHFTDIMGMTTVEGPEPFRALLREMGSFGGDMAAFVRDRLGPLEGAALFDRWLSTAQALVTALRAADPEVRLTWPGPGMKPRMFATARQMETWAHGTEIYDLLGTQRQEQDRIENIVTIGVRTYGWSFQNRRQEPPEPVPHLKLTAPSGALWTHNEPSSDERIEGSAVAFCQVVTQTRNIADVPLTVTGPNASAWMAIAQCFAGPPSDPPAPGTRPGPLRADAQHPS